MSNKLEATFHGSRDERWEDVYACVAPFVIDIDDQPVEFIKIGFYVWYKGGFYWQEQHLAKDDVDLVKIDIFSWLMNEMVSLIDEHLDKGIEE